MEDEKRLVEAALYIAGRPLTIHEIREATGIATLKRTRQLIKELADEYESRASALEIARLPHERFVLQLAPSLSERVAQLAPRGLLSLAELKTLAFIALKQPILQSEVVRQRGTHSYKHIKTLEEFGLIRAEPRGRTKELVTTQMFADYFGFDYEIERLKGQLRRMIRKIQQETEQAST